jgi:hypothetical protein
MLTEKKLFDGLPHAFLLESMYQATRTVHIRLIPRLNAFGPTRFNRGILLASRTRREVDESMFRLHSYSSTPIRVFAAGSNSPSAVCWIT